MRVEYVGDGIWEVWDDDELVFTGSLYECTDWLDWNENQPT